MKHLFLTAVVTASVALPALFSCSQQTTQTEGEEIFFADPTIYVENGKYYLTGTGNPDGFTMLESTDLKTWVPVNADTTHFILKKGESTFGDKGFWAPQIYKEGDKYYYFYTANEQTVVAKADTITGPYTQENIRPIDGSEKNIDPFLFKDDDGKYYLYHVRFDHGNYLWVAEYDMAGDSINKATLTQCFKATEQWEDTDEPNQWDPIMEGPTVFKNNGTYYLMYSANHYLNPDYAVGYASAPSPKGPWTKHSNSPIIHMSKVGEKGSGHGDLFTGIDGNPYYVYHVHYSDSVVGPRRTRIVPLNIAADSTGVLNITVNADGIIIPHVVK